MSAFLLYFETKNTNSTNYKGFSDVGKFIVPDEIFSGTIGLDLNGSICKAAMISDRGRQSCNDFFLKNNETRIVREIMFDFIRARLKNECVVSNVAKFIFNNQDMVTLTDVKVGIEYQDLEKFFNRRLFDEGSYLSIER